MPCTALCIIIIINRGGQVAGCGTQCGASSSKFLDRIATESFLAHRSALQHDHQHLKRKRSNPPCFSFLPCLPSASQAASQGRGRRVRGSLEPKRLRVIRRVGNWFLGTPFRLWFHRFSAKFCRDGGTFARSKRIEHVGNMEWNVNKRNDTSIEQCMNKECDLLLLEEYVVWNIDIDKR